MARKIAGIPRISIIVPVFKTPVFLLERFLESALGQSLAEIEIVAVDDASPDDCPKILDAAAAKDQRMMVIHRTENGRAGTARNNGLEHAIGKYVLFADADDILQPDMCEKLYKLAIKQDADIVSCSFTLRNETGNIVGRRKLPNYRIDLSIPRQRSKAYKLLNYSLWNKIFRKDVIAPIRFEQFETNIGEDTLYNITALCFSRILITTSYCGYKYTIHQKSVTGRLNKGMPYLRTLQTSNERIRNIIVTYDKTEIGINYFQRFVIKRFVTGCRWINEYPDKKVKKVLFKYWRSYLRDTLSAQLGNKIFLKYGCYFLTTAYNTKLFKFLSHFLYYLADPHNLVMNVGARTGLLHQHKILSY
jgi:glycosyltransferase involved in cell wall biosynthesis